MRIAIDARTICDAAGGSGAGVEHYTWSTVFALVRQAPEHRFFVFVPKQLAAARRAALIAGCRNVTLVPALNRHVLFPLVLKTLRADALFVPTPNLPVLWNGPSVVTVHDQFIFEHPEWFPKEDAASFSTKRLVPRSLKRATRIVAVSEAARRSVERAYPGRAERVSVAYPAVEAAPVSQDLPLTRFPVPAEYVLFLGTVEPRKNLSTAFYAFHQFLTDHPERAATLRFLVAGKWGWKTSETREAMDRVNAWWRPSAGDNVIQAVGPVLEGEKWPLLRGASAFVFPSLDEGFGLPVLEAMSVGVPVLCSDRGALPEVAGDAGLFAPAQDVEKFALLFAQALLMPEAIAPLREEGKRRSYQFTWDKTAAGVMKALVEAANEKPTR